MEVVLLSDVNHGGWIRGAGAYRLASELRSNGFATQVIDFVNKFTEDEARRAFDKFITKNTKLIGISNTFLNTKDDKLFDQEWMVPLLKEYKSKYDITVIIGGNRSGFSHYKKVSEDLFDIVVLGFADLAIVEIAKAARNKDLGSLKINRQDDMHYINCKTDYVYQDFNNSSITWEINDCILHGEHLPIETARGCIFRCSFCFFPGNGKRNSGDYMKNRTVLRNELIRNYELFGTTTYDIMDDLLNDSPEKCQFIYDVFSNLPFKAQFASYARADLLISQPQTLPLLEESGCIAMQFGIETLNKESGKTIGKAMDRSKMIEGLHWIKENSNISMGSGFIVGLPFETKESINDTVKWLASKDCPLENKEIYPLGIKRMEDKIDYSKMMINPVLYGYKDLEPTNEKEYVWDNGLMNFYEASELAKKAKNILRPYNYFNAHQLIRVMNFGFTKNQALAITRGEFIKKYNVMISGTLNNIKKKQYLEKLMSL